MKEETVSLYEYLSSAKAASVRRIIKVIKHGGVTVDEKIIDDPNVLISVSSKVIFEEKEIPYVYHFVLILNKPSGYMSSTIDEKYPSLLHLLPEELASRAILAGRLDHDTEGLIILSDIGRLTNRLVLPEFHVEKEYVAQLDKPLEEKDFQDIIENGTDFNGEIVKPISLVVNEGRMSVNIVVSEGKYHEIKRIFRRRGYIVTKLTRVRLGNLELGDLEVGKYRLLRKDEEKSLFDLVGLTYGNRIIRPSVNKK